jgi:L-iditol 2-dehydrogenase
MGDVVLINGCGTIGLMTLQAVKASGASRIIMSDLDDARLELAGKMGATDLINSAKSKVTEQISALTQGKGVDLAFDAVGVEDTVQAAIYSLRKGGCVVAIGNIGQEIKFPLQYCITRQIRVQGSCASSGEYDVCLAMIASKKVDLTPFLQNKMPLEQGKEAFERFYRKEPNLLKIILEP